MQKEWWEHPKASEGWLDVGEPQGQQEQPHPALGLHLEWLSLELHRG